MARVLFINGGSEGHINPTIGVVQELISRGEEVVYFSIEAFRERIERTGASVRTFDDQKFIKAFISGGRDYLLERINGLLLTADIIIPSVLEQIKGEHFDYIIHDSMFGCGRILAQILKLPAINSCTSFAQTKESFNHIMEQFSINVPKDIVKPINDKFQNLTAMVKEKYGVEIHSPYEVFCNPAPLTIVYTTREFQPYGEAFDQTYKFVGPSISSRLTQESFDFTAIKEKKPIYISLGTVFNRAIDFYKLCIEAFGNTDHTVVMSIGNRTQVSDLGEVPENFIVKNDVPQTDILQHTKLFITHGGMNSTHEGLYYGVPLIIIPQSADQPIIAGQVANMGAGIKLQMESLTANQLREAADHVLSLPFKKAVAHMRESFQKTGGYHQAVNEIFAFKGQYHI
ncbi:MGT family glycosyltransferase [Paenibacillus jamilae]|jgi:MGT family glycosyltransferase|uniref:macrolide family glycosyltransferase n=1 Tax=Paenibacillus TaxID=44249 RepID=UPI000D324CA4|nr:MULTISPECIES: macrolide family glycosyltransferase [Paenibacillus]MDP9675649.1 MGT family glycosyltransferase [Paenibacillus jamilae]KAF6616519.1 glycosyl transferase family 1 [Paenibacillus sp. EKM101P]KAF6623817.1 glycosyl transferase family 1 [Paenibacillus sp. EKM102P]KAF6633617.1 glycosyl transferase family 1 [Paenibacillus sp. EKM10P]KAF6649146.1 glycosyl transferase family 1 [Paenibacillus sp. EKM11P]